MYAYMFNSVFFLLLVIELRALHMLDKNSTTELQPQTVHWQNSSLAEPVFKGNCNGITG